NIAVENIDLVGTTVEGIIRVRNLTFNKCIAVYFTLDNWETTSEVTARYKESFSNSTFDRFIFLIKLADVLSRAQEKTLYLSIRYAVFGREIWDNNGGRNYQVRIAMFESCEESFQDDDINHIMDLLRRQLEQVVK
ncbi:putative phosphatase regulatory subunit-domain-containing protein, partial [Russula vinacea]